MNRGPVATLAPEARAVGRPPIARVGVAMGSHSKVLAYRTRLVVRLAAQLRLVLDAGGGLAEVVRRDAEVLLAEAATVPAGRRRCRAVPLSAADAEAAVRSHGGLSPAARALGISVGTLRSRLSGDWCRGIFADGAGGRLAGPAGPGPGALEDLTRLRDVEAVAADLGVAAAAVRRWLARQRTVPAAARPEIDRLLAEARGGT